MNLEKLIPLLYTKDIKKTLDFYVKILDFECKAFDYEAGWASLKFDEIEIMLSLPNEHLHFDKPFFTGSFYFKTNKVDEIWEKIKDKVEIIYPIENFEYGMREFAIYDNNSYMLQFGQAIK